MKIERREIIGLEVRADDEGGSPIVRGKGVPFNEWSEDLGGFRERILPTAFRASIADGDIRCLMNHNNNLVLGRTSNDTLRLQEQENGLNYEVDVNPDDMEAMSAVARIRRGDISGNSFGFRVDREGGQEWEERDGVLWRTIRSAELFELGPQTFPAYPQTTVDARSITEVRELGLQMIRDAIKDEKRGTEVDLLEMEMDEDEASLLT